MTRPTAKIPAVAAGLARGIACALLLRSITALAFAGGEDAAPVAPSSTSPVPAPVTSAAASAQPTAPVAAARVVAGVYRGTFGSNTIEMTLTQDQDAEDSVHGWYVVLGSAKPERVQLAGEWEDDTLSLEESHNGVDVSGNWNAIFNDDGFAGQWSDINGEHATDIALHRVKPTITKNKS
jgi:hypothetical protein